MWRHHIVNWFRNVLAVSVALDATSTCVAYGTLMVDNDEADNIANCRGTWPRSAAKRPTAVNSCRVYAFQVWAQLNTLALGAGFRRLQGEATTQAES
jgi:hypothetical protein